MEERCGGEPGQGAGEGLARWWRSWKWAPAVLPPHAGPEGVRTQDPSSVLLRSSVFSRKKKGQKQTLMLTATSLKVKRAESWPGNTPPRLQLCLMTCPLVSQSSRSSRSARVLVPGAATRAPSSRSRWALLASAARHPDQECEPPFLCFGAAQTSGAPVETLPGNQDHMVHFVGLL